MEKELKFKNYEEIFTYKDLNLFEGQKEIYFSKFS